MSNLIFVSYRSIFKVVSRKRPGDIISIRSARYGYLPSSLHVGRSATHMGISLLKSINGNVVSEPLPCITRI
jgi:hypothetical protein